MAVLLPDVLDNLGPAFLAHVYVQVGRFVSLRVGEPLKEQAIADRIHVGNTESIPQ